MATPETLGPLHAYLAGVGTDIRGRRIEEVLALSDDALERIHDYIQWLFPLTMQSMAQPGAPVLSEPEIRAIRADERARANLRRAAERMREFYARTDHWLTWHDHNHLRISRILRSLRLLLGPEAAESFYRSIKARHEAAGAPVNPRSLSYWAEAAGSDPGPTGS